MNLGVDDIAKAGPGEGILYRLCHQRSEIHPGTDRQALASHLIGALTQSIAAQGKAT